MELRSKGKAPERLTQSACKAPERSLDSLLQMFEANCKISLPQMASEAESSSLESRGFERVWEALSSSECLSPERRQRLLDLAVEAEKKVPLLPSCSTLTPEEHWKYLQLALPEIDPSSLLNLSAIMKACVNLDVESSSSFQDRGINWNSGSSSSFQSFQDRGMQLMTVEVDTGMPHFSTLNDSRAEAVWPVDQWVISDSPANAMKQMLPTLKYSGCYFDLVEKGSCESVCGKGSKPDMLLKLKSHDAAVYCIGALICLHSKGAKSRFDNMESLAEAEDYAMRFLRLAGPSRNFIIVGIIDLQNIMCLKFFHEGQNARRAVTTTQVRKSLCAFLVANPNELDVNMSSAELHMPIGWRWKIVLGCGKTSVVHEFKHENQSYAVKVARGKFKINFDYAFLTMLDSVDGVPRLKAQLGEMLSLQPVGVPFTKEYLHKHELTKSFGQLVDILQVAHVQGIVNRDVRTENFMIARSQGLYRFYILDWGFASMLGTRSSFAGCLYTASDNVLQQLQDGIEAGVIFEAADDLVSLLRCIWMFCNQELSKKLKVMVSGQGFEKQAQLLLSFWKQQMTLNASWKQAHEHAATGKVSSVKDWLKMVGECI